MEVSLEWSRCSAGPQRRRGPADPGCTRYWRGFAGIGTETVTGRGKGIEKGRGRRRSRWRFGRCTLWGVGGGMGAW